MEKCSKNSGGFRQGRRFGWPDLFLIGGLLAFGFGCFLFRPGMAGAGDTVRISVDGQVYGEYPLNGDNQVIPIKTEGTVTNTLEISDGQAKMVKADCPDQLCMHQKAISGQGGMICCLPNKVVVEAVGGKSAPFDSLSH